MTHIDLLKQHDACESAIKWASQYPDLATAWDNCQRADWMIWLHNKKIIQISDRDLRLFACDCVRHTPIGGGRTAWDLLTDERSRNAVEVAERYANGEATDDELIAAEKAARAAAWAAAGARAASAEASAWAFQADLLRKRIGNPFEGGHEL